MLATLTDLNTEWARLVPGSGATVAAWAEQHPCLRPAADLAALLDLVAEHPDATIGALLSVGRTGEPLAWRVVLQAMLGSVVLLCRRRPERFDEAVSELWLAIAEYPLDRRPRSIAANLAWTMRRWFSEPIQLDAAPPSFSQDATAEDTLTAARTLRLIDADTHRTLWLVYVAGLTSARAAAELGTTPELVRYRCSRSLRRLAQHADLLSA